MQRKWFVMRLAAGLAISSISGGLAAQEPAASDSVVTKKEQADHATEVAKDAMAKGDFKAACRLLEWANELDPQPLREMDFIDCVAQMGLYGDAYGRMLDLAAKVPPDSASVPKERAEEIKAEAPCIVIDVPSHLRTIRELEVALDGTPIPAASWNDVCTPVNLGHHTVTAKAPQRAWLPQRLSTFKIKERYTITLNKPFVEPPPPRPEEKKDMPPGVIPTIVVGLSLLGVGVGTLVGVNQQEQTWPMGILSGALLGTGVGLLGTSAAIYATSTPSPSHAALRPGFTNGTIGIVGRF